MPSDCVVVVFRCEGDVVPPAAARLGGQGLGVVETTVLDDGQGREAVEWGRREVPLPRPVDFFPILGIGKRL